MGNFLRVCIAVILILSIFTVSVFATPTGTYDMYSFDGRNIVGSSGSGNQYISNFTRSLAYIHSIIANISTTIDYYLPNMNNNLHYIHVALVDAFSPGAGDTRSMWTLTSQAVSGITAIQSAALGIAQDVYNINTNITDIDRLAGLIHSDVDQVESQLTNINTNLQSLESINWINTNSTVTISYDGINYGNLSDFTDNTYRELYFKIHKSTIDSNLIKIYIPFYISVAQINYDSINVDLNYDLDYFVERHPRYMNVYIYPLNFYNSNSADVIIKLSSAYRFYSQNNSVVQLSYIPVDTNDFYVIDQFIQNHKQSSDTTLQDIKNILIDIDNNSDFIQNNNDLEINVDIDAADGQGVTAIILKLQDIFDFGVGLQEFLVTLNEFDNLHWFTSPETYNQVNQDPRFSPGYIDLYD